MNAADSAREGARQSDGRFGTQPLDEAVVGLAETATHPGEYDAPRPGRFYCTQVTSYDCLAPAGFGAGGRSARVRGVRRADLLTCGYCGEPVCKNCQSEFDGKPVCSAHEPEELADWIGLVSRPRIRSDQDAATPVSAPSNSAAPALHRPFNNPSDNFGLRCTCGLPVSLCDECETPTPEENQ